MKIAHAANRAASGSIVLATLLLATGLVGAQDHPAFAVPTGFAATASTATDRTFERKLINNDVLRITVLVQPAGTEPEAIAKGPALGTGDEILSDRRQEVSVGTLTGVAYSVKGSTENIEGVPFTRYRRVFGFTVPSAAPFAVRADVLATEPTPAKSTLQSLAEALTAWQNRVGGVSAEPPPDPTQKDPASRPSIGGESKVVLTGGGDMEMRIPAYWGRKDLKHSDGHTEILVGPARDIIGGVTIESLAKDKDRIGPYLSVARIQKDTFKDLVDVQLSDIADGLLADYIANQGSAGVTLTLGARDEGPLGTRNVLSVPFEEKRASGTTHKGRAIFMLHRGSLVIVTASHPTEGFDDGWKTIADPFDTLVFTGAVEVAPESKPAEGAAPPTTPPATPTNPNPSTTPPTAPPTNPPTANPAGAQPAAPADTAPPPAPTINVTGGLRLGAAGADWLRAPNGALRSAAIPFGAAAEVPIPAAWSLIGDVDPKRNHNVVVATPDPASAADPVASCVRVEEIGLVEQLAEPNGLARLTPLLRLRLEQSARMMGLGLEVRAEQQAMLAGLPAATINYALRRADRAAAGTISATVFDGTVFILDVRFASNDPLAAGTMTSDILNGAKVDAALHVNPRTCGFYSVEVPEGWTVNDAENPGNGRDIFLQSPAGVDVRFQTAIQGKSGPNINYAGLRGVSSRFLVDSLHVLRPQDLMAAKTFVRPGARIGMRFASVTDMDVIALAWIDGEHLVFGMRAAPVAYHGRDVAIAWRVLRSFGVPHSARALNLDPLPVVGAAVARRCVFSREELDAVGPDGVTRGASTFLIALSPDGTAGVVVSRGGVRRDLRASYRVEGDGIVVEGPGIGRMKFRIGDNGETLIGEAPGDVMFRARHEENQ